MGCRLRAGFSLLTVFLLPTVIAGGEPAAGIVVETVRKGGASESAGIRAGDLLLSWERPAVPPHNPEPASGVFASPFDLDDAVIEQAPRGPVTVHGTRNGEAFSIVMPPGAWRMSVRPVLGPEVLAAHRDALQRIAEGNVETGARAAEALILREDSEPHRAWFRLETARALDRAGRWDLAEAAYYEAIEIADKRGDVTAVVRLHEWLAAALRERRHPEEARRSYEESVRLQEEHLGSDTLLFANTLLAQGNLVWGRGESRNAVDLWKRALLIQQRLAPGSLRVAVTLNNLGVAAGARDDLESARDYHERSLAIREKLAPESVLVAESLNNLGTLGLGEDQGESYYRRALTIWERLRPDSLVVAGALHNLGFVADQRGELARAEGYYRKALRMRERLAPGGRPVAASLQNLGNIVKRRGDLAAAEEYYRRALEIREDLGVVGGGVAGPLVNLGTLERLRGDVRAAEDHFRRALGIYEEHAPGSGKVAACLLNLGDVARDRGDLDAAEDHYRQALAVLEKIDAQDLRIANTVHALGGLALARGDLARAEDDFLRAMEIRNRIAPGGLAVAASLHALGELAVDGEDPEGAEKRFRQSLAIRRRFAPGSLVEAETAHALGALLRQADRSSEAIGFLARAVDALESQLGKLGGTEDARAGFRARFQRYYWDYMELLLEQGSTEQAFHVMERSRARSFLALLAERDLVFEADIPEDLERARKRNATEYDAVQDEIAKLGPDDEPERAEELLDRLEELKAERARIVEDVRRASPGLAALTYPEPLDASRTRDALEPGTLLLCYDVGKDETFLFALSPDVPVRAYRLPIGEEGLRRAVTELRRFIEGEGRAFPGMLARSRQLFETLLGPVRELIGAHVRLVIVPDGPLHVLPLAALVVPGPDPQEDWRYLVEWKPLQVVVSATTYAELRRSRGGGPDGPGGPILVAFGDPLYPSARDASAAEGSVGPRLRSLRRLGYAFPSLPASRREVAAAAAVFGERSVVYVGGEATEERAKIDRRASVIHFATHGFFDPRLPLDSGLALTIPEEPMPEQENGLLQAWEVFESVRLDVDLVVLSGCQTFLGEELAGEGLIGLTRAFQYAGARSVLASLWNVADLKTAVLMERFYRHLARGLPASAALRAAQLEILRAPIDVVNEDGETVSVDATHPFYWAGFVLSGADARTPQTSSAGPEPGNRDPETAVLPQRSAAGGG